MKKLIISKNNKSKNSKENLYLNYQSYFDFFEDHEDFDKNENIVPHYSNHSKDVNFHLLECEKLYNKILPDLLREFNNFHKKNYSIKSGHLIFGFWLDRFIRISYDRYYLLKSAFKNFQIDEIKIFNTKNYNFSSTITQDISKLSSQKNWNYALISELLNYFELHKTKYSDNEEKFDTTNYFPIITKNFLVIELYKKICGIFKFFINENNSIITKTYFPFFLEKALEVKLNQLPFVWDFSFSIKNKVDIEKRSKISLKKNDAINEKNLENFIRLLIPKCLPISILEGFSDLVKLIEKYPKNPKMIISSVEFDTNDLFKIYCSEKIELGTKIISGQHGNGSFLVPESKYLPDLKFSDYYYTWGNKKVKNFIPFCNTNVVNKKNVGNKGKKLVIFTTSYGWNFTLYDRQEINFQNINLIQELVSTLPQNIKSSLILKKHNAKTLKCHNSLEMRYDNLNITKLINKTFSEALNHSKLNLYLYNSTGVMDCLALNKPVIFYIKNISNLYSKDFYDKLTILKDANIFFDDISELKKHIINIWDNVDDWWENKLTQEKIKNYNKNFNEKYTKSKFSDFYRFLKNLDHNN